MGWWSFCLSDQFWEDLRRMRKEYPLVQRLKKRSMMEAEMSTEEAERVLESFNGNPYDQAYLSRLNHIKYGQPLLVGLASFIALRTRRQLFPAPTSKRRLFANHGDAQNTSVNPAANIATGYGFDIAASMGASYFMFHMLSNCSYMYDKINHTLLDECRSNCIRGPGKSLLTDKVCTEVLNALQELRNDKTVDQTLLSSRDDAKLSILQGALDSERQCRLRFAFQKKLQREKGIADDSPLLPVRIPYPGVPNDDRLLLLLPSSTRLLEEGESLTKTEHGVPNTKVVRNEDDGGHDAIVFGSKEEIEEFVSDSSTDAP